MFGMDGPDNARVDHVERGRKENGREKQEERLEKIGDHGAGVVVRPCPGGVTDDFNLKRMVLDEDCEENKIF